MTAAIELIDIHKKYGRDPAVHRLNMSVARAEIFGFLGPNGAGKTTTIKMMTGLLEPTSGTVKIGGVDIWQSPIEAKRKLSYVPDEPNLYPKLTGWEYLQFIASVFKLEDETFTKRATELLKTFKLEARANELIEGYSHGMKQKLAITGALIHKPEVLFLDEPTVGLDPASAKQLKILLRDLCRGGTAVFLSTHILEIAERMCDRVGIINEGELIAVGTIDELRNLEGNHEASLEDIFLELTGGEDAKELIESLGEEKV